MKPAAERRNTVPAALRGGCNRPPCSATLLAVRPEETQATEPPSLSFGASTAKQARPELLRAIGGRAVRLCARCLRAAGGGPDGMAGVAGGGPPLFPRRQTLLPLSRPVLAPRGKTPAPG